MSDEIIKEILGETSKLIEISNVQIKDEIQKRKDEYFILSKAVLDLHGRFKEIEDFFDIINEKLKKEGH